MICLYCGKEAEEKGEFSQGLPIRECEDRHRTCLMPRGMYQEIKPEPFLGWIDEIKKAS